jgi:succinate dehydrogenase/fumarate reductase flavoprotein subunit
VIGSRYAAGGVSIANAIVFGRLAGQQAVAEVRDSASRTLRRA